MRNLAALLACTTLLSGAAHAQSIKKLDPALDKVIAPGTKIEKVATGFLFIEGPMWRDGKLWFSDVKGDKVRTFDPKTGTVYLVAPESTKPEGKGQNGRPLPTIFISDTFSILELQRTTLN